MLLPSSFPAAAPTPIVKHLYRSYLQHIRLLPDPHVWSILIPKYKRLLNTPGPADTSAVESTSSSVTSNDHAGEVPFAESSTAARERVREWKKAKAIKRAHIELRRLRAAVACHPHALARLLEETYGQRGAIRWDLLRSISSPYDSAPPLAPLPPPLYPLRPPPRAPTEAQPRARKRIPASTIRRETKRGLERDWRMINPPLILPFRTGLDRRHTGTGWESTPIDTNLALLAGLGVSTEMKGAVPPASVARQLNISCLDARLRRIFPRNLVNPTLREPPLEPPRPKATRQNPTTWSLPRRLSDRLLRRTYKRLWDGLTWVRPVPQPSSQAPEYTIQDVVESGSQERWKKCSYDEMKAWEKGDLTDHPTAMSTDDGPAQKRISKRQKAKKAADSVTSGEIKGVEKWSVANEEDKRLLDM